MASRKEQKEQLRREREEREAQARAAERRRRMIGLGAAAALVIAVVAVLGVLLLAGGDDEGGGQENTSEEVLPGGGSVPEPEITDLKEAASTAGCELKSYRGGGPEEHTADLDEEIKYDSNPPSHGRHFEVPAEDGSYETAPDPKEILHALEHGRIAVWFKKTLPGDARADLKALFDEDTYQMILTPNETNMPFEVAATAWNGDPRPGGTGRLLGCPKFNAQVFDAIRAFKDEHRANGPEAVP